MRNIKIIGCANALPQKKLRFGDQTRYRLAQDETLLDLAGRAAQAAMKDAGITIDDVDCIVGAMATPLQMIPCNAALIHERIAGSRDIPAFDINSSCTSFITAFDTVSCLMQSGRYETVLIISGDTASVGLNPGQKESYELFSDAVSAFVVTKGGGESGIIYAAQKTWSKGAHDTEIRGGGALLPPFRLNDDNREDYYFDMKGRRVIKLTSEVLPGFLKEFYEKSGYSMDGIDLVIPHQASRILGFLMPRLGIPKDKYIDRVSDYGNMISAAVPFTLCEVIHEGLIRRGETVMLLGTAAGLTINILFFKY